MPGRPSLSTLRKYFLSGLGVVSATLLRGAVTIRSTTAGGFMYDSAARTSLGFQPCWATFCAASGRARTARPEAPTMSRVVQRRVARARVIANSDEGCLVGWLTMVYGRASGRVDAARSAAVESEPEQYCSDSPAQ